MYNYHKFLIFLIFDRPNSNNISSCFRHNITVANLYYCKMIRTDFLITTKYCFIALQWVGLWPKCFISYGFNIYSFYAFSLLIIFFYLDVISQVIMLLQLVHNLEAFASSIYVLSVKLVVSAKTCKFFNSVKNLQKIFEEVDDDLFQPTNEIQQQIVKNILNNWKKFFVVFLIGVVSTVFSYIVSSSLNNWKNKSLFCPSWYPYNTKLSPFFEITYLHQVMAIILLAFINTFMDMLFCFLQIFIECQFGLLCDSLQRMKHSKKTEIRRCIQHHQKILK